MREGDTTRTRPRSDTIRWGLSDQLLDLAECHIGLPVRYLGVEAKREMVESAEGRSREVVRRWHLDDEDRRILKVVVYLSDVDAGAGPFGFVHQSRSGGILDSTNGRNLRGVSDDEMQTVVPQSEWRQVARTKDERNSRRHRSGLPSSVSAIEFRAILGDLRALQ